MSIVKEDAARLYEDVIPEEWPEELWWYFEGAMQALRDADVPLNFETTPKIQRQVVARWTQLQRTVDQRKVAGGTGR